MPKPALRFAVARMFRPRTRLSVAQVRNLIVRTLIVVVVAVGACVLVLVYFKKSK